MKFFLGWLKKNKLLALVFLALVCLVFKNYLFPTYRLRQGQKLISPEMSFLPPPMPGRDYAPAPEIEDRLVIRESTLSLLVENVVDSIQVIQQKTESWGGYLVNSDLYHSEETEAASGSITIRVPQEKLDDSLTYFRGLAVKVVSENISGQDVTDEYVDIEARLATLQKTKVKFEAILEKAEKVEDILKVQRELINLQQQIDHWQGRAQYLEKSAEMSRVIIYLSADELSLPYAPTQAWRPKVILKQAIRSLIYLMRKTGAVLIWFGVYAVIWVPVLVIYLFWRHRQKK